MTTADRSKGIHRTLSQPRAPTSHASRRSSLLAEFSGTHLNLGSTSIMKRLTKMEKLVYVQSWFLMIILPKIAADLAPNRETIKGFDGERLDILCPLHFPNIADQQIILFINSSRMITMDLKQSKTQAIHCISNHPYKKMCQTQMMNSNADKNNVHFVIDKVPKTLDGSTSQCVTDHDEFEEKTRRDPPRTIIIRERIKGYVNGTIKFPCRIRNGHREWSVEFKIYMNRTQTWNQSTDDFHCANDSPYFNVCRSHMNGSSYVNGSKVFFVIENTPACLNNSELHCFAKNFDILKENDHDTLEKILTLYKDPSTIISTASTPNRETAKTSSDTTTTSVPIPTSNATGPNATAYSPPGESQKENGLSAVEITVIVIGAVIGILIIIGAIVCRQRWQKKQEQQNRNDLELQEM